MELTFVLTIFLMLTIGTIDLSVGVFRYHIISQAARHAARKASVRGSMATPLGVWGPNSIDVPITATGVDIVDEVEAMLVGCDPSKTRITVEWPNGNELDAPIHVTITSKFQPTFTLLFPATEKTLTAKSVMRVAH